MTFNLENFLTSGSIMLTLYVIAVLLIYIAFLKKPSKSNKSTK